MNKANNAIGLVELSCIHKGFEVLDKMVKAASVEKILARTICSGKYIILVRGELADVEAALCAGKEAAEYGIVNALVIPNVDEALFPALAGTTAFDGPMAPDGMLVVETFSVASCIKAADFALKAASISMVRVHVAMAVGGKGYFVATGNIDALKSSLGPVLDFLKDEGSLVGYSLITQPGEELLREIV
jgi:microcompartment protein CcmL/EutN